MNKLVFKAFIPSVLVLICTSCTQTKGSILDSTSEQGIQYRFDLADFDYEIDLHTDLQKEYLLNNYNSIAAYANGTKHLSDPINETFYWNVTTKDELTFRGYKVYFSTDEEFSDPTVYNFSNDIVDITNLYADTHYFWKVEAYYDEDTLESKIGEFDTSALLPRNINVDGITNVRDIGGWNIDENHRVKQGMVYRTGRLNYSNTTIPTTQISHDGVETMLNVLKVKTEIDLRKDNYECGYINSSVLGNKVRYFHKGMRYDGNLWTINTTVIKEIFTMLADDSNYPLFYHCNIGTDRTGIISYLLNGLLGVKDSDLYRDYLFSNFGNIESSRSLSNINDYVTLINQYPGATKQQKIERALVDIGVSQDDLDYIKEIMIEEI